MFQWYFHNILSLGFGGSYQLTNKHLSLSPFFFFGINLSPYYLVLRPDSKFLKKTKETHGELSFNCLLPSPSLQSLSPMMIQKIQLLWSNETAKLIIMLLFLFILSMKFSFIFLNTKSHFFNFHVLVCIKYSMIRSAIIFFCCNTTFSFKLLFLQDFFLGWLMLHNSHIPLMYWTPPLLLRSIHQG